MSIKASVQGTIQLTDSLTGSVSLSKVLNNAYVGTVQSYGQSVIIGTNSTNITLPITPIEFLYIRNLSTTSGASVTATWTPNGGSTASIITLDAGAVIIFSEVVTTNGISALSIIGAQSGTPIEYIICG